MDEWRKYRLGDLFERVTRKNINLESENVLTISAQYGLINQEEFFNKSVAGKNLNNYYLLKKGEFAYNKSYSAGYPMGATKMLEKYDEGIVSTLYICFRSKSDLVNNEYFKYYFESKQYYDELSKIAEEGARNHGLLNISVEDFFNIQVILPPIKEQEKIVNLLKKIDYLIKKYEKLLKEKDKFIKSQFVKMFGDVINNTKNFDYKPIGEISEIVTGTTPSTSNIENWNGNICWITPAELDNNSIYIFDTERKITEKGKKSKSLKLMPKGTVLFTSRAPIGKVAIINKEMCCNQGFKNCICKKELNNLYLYYTLKNNAYYFNRLGAGSTFRELSKSTFEKVKISVPPMELQNKFAEFVKQVDKQKFLLEQQKKNYEKLKKALMQKLLIGKVRVKI